MLEHAGFLRGLVRGLVHDGGDADDVLQETWLFALERPPAHRRNLRAWLASIARNVVRRSRRDVQRRERRERIAARPEQVPSGDDAVARLEVLERLVRRVKGLEEPYRSVVLDRFFHGLSNREIAAREGILESTVRTRLQRALARLRAGLDQEHGGDRRLWMSALVPLFSLKTASATGTAGTMKTVAGGSLIMGTKIKSGIVVLVVGIVALLAWQGFVHRGDRDTRPNPSERQVVEWAAVPERSRPSAAVEPRDGSSDPIVPPGVDQRIRVVAGIVVDAGTERPVQGLDLVLVDRSSPALTEFVTRTDRRGRFRFDDRSVSLGELCLETREQVPNLTVSRAEALPLARIHRDADAGDLRVVFPWRGWLEGCVVGPDRTPVEGAQICVTAIASLQGLDTSAILDRAWREQGIRSAADGSFRIDRLPAEVGLVVAARHPDFASGRCDPVSAFTREGELPIEIRLAPACCISGRVVGPDGAPVPGAWILANREERLGGDILQQRPARADQEGHFEFRNCEEGHYSLDASTDMPQSAHGHVFVDVDEGRSAETLIRIETWPWFFEGSVVDARGDPVPGVHVSADSGGAHLASVTEANGTFRIETPDPGPYELFAFKPGTLAMGERVEVSASTTGILLVLDIPDTSLLIEVVDAATGQRLAEADAGLRLLLPDEEIDPIEALRRRCYQSGMTNAEGEFESDFVPPGRYEIWACAPGYALETREVEWKPPSSVVMRLIRGRRVAGTVVDADGRPVGGVSVAMVHWVCVLRSTMVASAPDGTFAIDSLPCNRDGQVAIILSNGVCWDRQQTGETDVIMMTVPDRGWR